MSRSKDTTVQWSHDCDNILPRTRKTGTHPCNHSRRRTVRRCTRAQTRPTPFGFVLSWYPPGPTTVSQPITLSPNSYVDTDPRWLRLNLKCKVTTLYTKPSSQMKRRSARYKQHYNAKVHVEPEFLHNQFVFVNRLPFISKTSTADEMVKACYAKLRLQSAVPFQTIEAQPHTVVINEYIVASTVSIQSYSSPGTKRTSSHSTTDTKLTWERNAQGRPRSKSKGVS